MQQLKPDWWAAQLLDWSATRGRKGLPWKTDNPNLAPYYALVSEVMLQQTQASRVSEYFPRFIAAFPDLASLARADLSRVLVYWSGLGYYRRAGYLHQSAGRLHERAEQGLGFPREPEVVAALPGIGPSTANAILAQAFNLPLPILDANARRIITRLYGLRHSLASELWRLADRLTQARPARANAAAYCQAIMDFGSLVCGKKPQCEHCFAAPVCKAGRSGAIQPSSASKQRAKQPMPLRLALVQSSQGLWLRPQQPGQLWPHTLMPPCAPGVRALLPQLEATFGLNNLSYLGRTRATTLLSHRKVRVQALAFRCNAVGVAEPGREGWYDTESDSLPLSSLARRLIEWRKEFPNNHHKG